MTQDKKNQKSRALRENNEQNIIFPSPTLAETGTRASMLISDVDRPARDQ